MAETKEKAIIAEKRAQVETLARLMKEASITIITDYRGPKAGLTVKDSRTLRGRLKAEQSDFKVVKNTIARRAAQAAGMPELDPYFEGPTALAFGFDDPSSTAKVLAEFAKEFKKRTSVENGLPLVKCGLLGERFLEPKNVAALALLPSKKVVLSQVLGTLQAPICSIVNVLAAPMRDLVNVLTAVKDKQEKAA